MNTDKYIDGEENICVILCSFVATFPLVYLRVTSPQFVASTFANKALIEIHDKRKPLIMYSLKFYSSLFYFAPVQHIEFVHSEHFETNYHRHHVAGPLSLFIEFFWQTKFDHLWQKYPEGFSDVLFPNLGYSYLINLGSPYEMQIGENRQQMKGDGFLPRLNNIEAFHRPGNSVFGIKFKVSPVIFEKKVNFSEYSGTMFPLSYLMDQQVINNIKHAGSFEKRVQLLTHHYEEIVEQYRGSLQPINIITEILQKAVINNNFNTTIEDLAAGYSISTRTLQRYFETGTGISSKQALQVLRIRKAVSHIISRPQTFHYAVYGYYDYSHFHKHLRQFLQKDSLVHLQPHLQLLQIARKKELR